MNKEELKAIEYLQAYIKNDKEDIKILNNTIDEDIDYYTEVEPIQKRVKYLETIKNLIEKLQKEIEELRQNYDTATTKTEEQKEIYKKIKIIDIFTMIANGEQPPRKIRYDMLSKEYQILIYAPEEQEYRFENDLDNIWTVPNHHLKDTVEILEV